MHTASRFLFFLLCVGVIRAQQFSNAASLLRQGQALLDAKEYETAANRFEQSYNWQPQFEPAFSAGYCYFRLKKFPEAELWLKKAQALNPESEEATVYLASAEIGNRKPQEAISLLQEFIKSHPDARQASITAAAIRSDLNPQATNSRSISQFSILMIALSAVSLGMFFVSLRASNTGIREAGKALGWIGLSSLCALGPFPGLLCIAGYAWAGHKLHRGYELYRYLKREGAWAELMRSELFKFVGAFVTAGGTWDDERVQMAINGLARAGLDRRTAREVQGQLSATLFYAEEAGQAVARFAKADTLIREILLRLLAGIALQLGYDEKERELLADFATGLRLQYKLADLLADLGHVVSQQPKRAADPLADYFQILEVPISASRQEVKSGYRKQAKRYHPDVTSHLGSAFAVGAADQFRNVRHAYQAICKAKGWSE